MSLEKSTMLHVMGIYSIIRDDRRNAIETQRASTLLWTQ